MVAHRISPGRTPGRSASTIAIIGILAFLSIAVACDKVPLLAPTGSVITLFPTATSVPLNGEITIVATVIENGVAAAAPATGTGTGTGTTTTTRPGAGTPVQNGTLVSFTTTIGRIEPTEARTRNGQVSVRFVAAGQSGNAKITAFSGGASGTLENLLVGSAAAKRITVTANPQALGASGGTTEIVARVEDEAGTALPGVPVTFTADACCLSPTSTNTDASGVARANLTTSTPAKVTATTGAQSGTVNVTLAARSGLSVSASPQATSVGTPVTFTIATNATANLSDARIDYGDGRSRQLGTLNSTQTDQHVYSSPGSYSVTVTARDSTNTTEQARTAVTIGSLPVTLTAFPNPATVGSNVTLTVGGVSSAQVDRYEFFFDDGTPKRTSGAPQTSHVFNSRGNKTVRVDVIGLGGGLIGTQTIVVNVT